MAAVEEHKARHVIERAMFASRWLLAPIFLGLIVALLLLVVKFFQELVATVPHVLDMQTSELIVEVLSLVDLSLVANLLVMMMLAGYENFISGFVQTEGVFRPRWLGHIDYGALKLKLISSIVAIASVKGLELFLNPGGMQRQDSLLHLAMLVGFALTAVLLALMDRLATGSESH